jgi:hypothetical protein
MHRSMQIYFCFNILYYRQNRRRSSIRFIQSCESIAGSLKTRQAREASTKLPGQSLSLDE